MVLRRCRYLLRDEESAVDAMHDAFVKVLRYQGSLDASAPSSLLFRIATNVCLNRIRSHRRHPEDADSELLERIARAPDGERIASARQLLDRIFDREPLSTRDMAVMHLLDGMTLEEVAEQTGLSVSGVRRRLRIMRAHVAELEGV